MCYGTKALKVGNLQGGFVYTSELLTKDVEQKVLSAKHILKTDAEKIEITPGYEKYFSLENSTLIPTDEKKFDIFFPEDYLDNIQESLTIYITKDLIPITISNYASISIPEEIEEQLKEVVLDDKIFFKISSSQVLNFWIIVSIIPKNKITFEVLFNFGFETSGLPLYESYQSLYPRYDTPKLNIADNIESMG